MMSSIRVFNKYMNKNKSGNLLKPKVENSVFHSISSSEERHENNYLMSEKYIGLLP